MNVTKRDGRVVLFDKEKIKTAVIKAFLDVDGEETSYAKDKARDIANYIENLNKEIEDRYSVSIWVNHAFNLLKVNGITINIRPMNIE